jgi:hypothetical protein
VAVLLLKWFGTYQPCGRKGIDSQPVLFVWSNQTNSMNQIDQTDQKNLIDQSVQNRAERPMPTLVFLMDLASKTNSWF